MLLGSDGCDGVGSEGCVDVSLVDSANVTGKPIQSFPCSWSSLLKSFKEISIFAPVAVSRLKPGASFMTTVPRVRPVGTEQRSGS
jgi:hypothetical protein